MVVCNARSKKLNTDNDKRLDVNDNYFRRNCDIRRINSMSMVVGAISGKYANAADCVAGE